MSRQPDKGARYYLGDPCGHCGKSNTFIEIEYHYTVGGCYSCSRKFTPSKYQIEKAKEGAATWHF